MIMRFLLWCASWGLAVLSWSFAIPAIAAIHIAEMLGDMSYALYEEYRSESHE